MSDILLLPLIPSHCAAVCISPWTRVMAGLELQTEPIVLCTLKRGAVYARRGCGGGGGGGGRGAGCGARAGCMRQRRTTKEESEDEHQQQPLEWT
eukprot:9336284-Pyramimonas_sp.AAC.1